MKIRKTLIYDAVKDGLTDTGTPPSSSEECRLLHELRLRRRHRKEANRVPDNAIGYAMHSSRSHDAVIRVYDATGNVIETHGHKGDFKEW